VNLLIFFRTGTATAGTDPSSVVATVAEAEVATESGTTIVAVAGLTKPTNNATKVANKAKRLMSPSFGHLGGTSATRPCGRGLSLTAMCGYMQ